MNIENKAKELVAQLLGENEGITIVGIDDPEGGYIAINGGPEGGNYIYHTGYNGGDSHDSGGLIIQSSTPLQPFDDFNGRPEKYPVIAQISKALEDAGYEGLDGFGAGKLERKG
jgi:hypothetical protein